MVSDRSHLVSISVSALTSRKAILRTCSRLRGFEVVHYISTGDDPFQQGPEAQVVRHASVHQVDIGFPLGVHKGDNIVGQVKLSVGQVSGLQGLAQRLRGYIITASGIIFQGDRRQQNRHRRRGGAGPGHREGVQIGTDQIEEILGEGHPAPVNHVRAVDEDHGFRAPAQVGEGRPLEDVFIVIFGGQVATAKKWREQP